MRRLASSRRRDFMRLTPTAPRDYVFSPQASIRSCDAVADTVIYDIFKDDFTGSPLWIEAVEGFEPATNRMEELAAIDKASDYYLFCAQAGKIIRRLRRTSARLDEPPGGASHKKAGNF
jgi:hypothetical protein